MAESPWLINGFLTGMILQVEEIFFFGGGGNGCFFLWIFLAKSFLIWVLGVDQNRWS